MAKQQLNVIFFTYDTEARRWKVAYTQKFKKQQAADFGFDESLKPKYFPIGISINMSAAVLEILTDLLETRKTIAVISEYSCIRGQFSKAPHHYLLKAK